MTGWCVTENFNETIDRQVLESNGFGVGIVLHLCFDYFVLRLETLILENLPGFGGGLAPSCHRAGARHGPPAGS